MSAPKTAEKAIRIFWLNMGEYATTNFTSVREAANYGKSKGFGFAVHQGDTVHGAWSVFGGWKHFTEEGKEGYAR